jgi:hypothetical protein
LIGRNVPGRIFAQVRPESLLTINVAPITMVVTLQPTDFVFNNLPHPAIKFGLRGTAKAIEALNNLCHRLLNDIGHAHLGLQIWFQMLPRHQRRIALNVSQQLSPRDPRSLLGFGDQQTDGIQVYLNRWFLIIHSRHTSEIPLCSELAAENTKSLEYPRINGKTSGSHTVELKITTKSPRFDHC